MLSSRRYAFALLVPPLVVVLPIALLFLQRVTRMPLAEFWPVVAVAVTAYLLGAVVAAYFFQRFSGRVAEDVRARRDPSATVSHALNGTVACAGGLWIVWGVVIAIAGGAVIDPSILGMQYFVETALIVAAPAMAWSYWVGKRLLLHSAAAAPHVHYQGRLWSVGAKIAIVFVGFFIVSAGALILTIASSISSRLGNGSAFEITRVGLVVALITTVAFAIATWRLANDITGPMQELMSLAADMADGRFDREPRIFADDEVGRLAQSFGITRQNLRTLLSHVGSRGESITEGVRMMSEGTDSLVGNAYEQSGMAAQSAVALTQVQNEAQSVLTEVDRVTGLTVDSSMRATELRASFAEVANRMDELFQSVEKSSSAAAEIDASARETANRTMNLAGLGNDVLAFAAEMDATIGQITRSAQITADLSEAVRENAVTGHSAVEATVDGIRAAQDSTRKTAGAFDELQKSLGKIDHILLFIDDVTNRTNLLSLNAAIIAAQAGRNDFGFTVIADEVRELADRTRSATKEIAGIIRSVQPIARQAVAAMDEGVQHVDHTVELVQYASDALKKILGSAEQSLDMTQSITKALREQAKASAHLHNVTAQMSENIAEMDRATHGQADATRMLAAEAERVSDIALQVKRGTEEQTRTGDGIADAMEQIASDVKSIRDRLDRQLHQAEQIAGASRITLSIAERNNGIAEQFRASLQALLHTGREFETEVSRFQG